MVCMVIMSCEIACTFVLVFVFVWFVWLLLLFVFFRLFGSFDLIGIVMTPLDCIWSFSGTAFLVHLCPKMEHNCFN